MKRTRKKARVTYTDAGVDYRKLDSLKLLAQREARKTTKNLTISGCREITESRGESAYVVDCGSFYLASIVEGLGTKALVADETRKITNKTYYDTIAQDTVATAVNDLITVGATPISIHAYWASGHTDWLDDSKRSADLVRGWKKACDLSGASWGGGETPTLSGVIVEKSCDLAVACMGIINPKKRLILGNKLRAGDYIIVFQSTGIQANGLTLARKIAQQLPNGYATKIESGVLYGEALLEPTIIYARLMNALFQSGVAIHYASNITGHGWRKIMRHTQQFTYRITKLPPVPLIFPFIQKHAELTIHDMYKTFNMGAGFAIFVSKRDSIKVTAIAKKMKIQAMVVGVVEKGKKQVIIEPHRITFEGKSLHLRE